MWKWIIIVASVAGMTCAVYVTARTTKVAPVPPLRQEPVRKPYPHAIVGAGLVEPESESVVIGVTEPGRVAKVFVSRGQKVKKDDPLFQVDTRALEAQKASAEAALRTAQADLARTVAYQRPEEGPILEAKRDQAAGFLAQISAAKENAEALVVQGEWTLKDHQSQVRRLAATVKANASPVEELEHEEFVVKSLEAGVRAAQAQAASLAGQEQAARAALAVAENELKLFKAGAWKPDVVRAIALADEAAKRVEGLAVEIERRIIRAPIDGSILRCNLHEGEYAGAGEATAEKAAVVIGDLSRLRVRVDIDEFDAARFKPGAEATAFYKGRPQPAFRLEFVTVEPFVVPKRALTNSQQELVDARTLQVIYRVASSAAQLYVGQQLDVFVSVDALGPTNSQAGLPESRVDNR